MKSLIVALALTGGIMLSLPAEIPPQPQETAPEREYIGEYEVTAYAGDTITATGSTPIPYRTVAVDPQVIPLETVLYIDGIGEVVAEDTGSAVKGKVIDIYLPGTEKETQSWGRQSRQVWKMN